MLFMRRKLFFILAHNHLNGFSLQKCIHQIHHRLMNAASSTFLSDAFNYIGQCVFSLSLSCSMRKTFEIVQNRIDAKEYANENFNACKRHTIHFTKIELHMQRARKTSGRDKSLPNIVRICVTLLWWWRKSAANFHVILMQLNINVHNSLITHTHAQRKIETHTLPHHIYQSNAQSIIQKTKAQ